LNNYLEEEISSIVPTLSKNCLVALFNKEVGESGTPHLQGYCEFKSKIRPLSLGLTKRLHWGDKDGKPAKGSREENVRYCTKDCNYDLNLVSWSFGFPKPPTTICEDTFYDWQKELVKIFKVECKWDCRKIYWRYGDKNIGKTQFAKWCVVNLGAVVIGGSHKHMLAQVQNQKSGFYIVLLSFGDDEVSYRALEQIKDGLFTAHFGTDNNKMEVRDAPHLLIIGNEPPNTDNRNFHPTKYNVAEIS